MHIVPVCLRDFQFKPGALAGLLTIPTLAIRHISDLNSQLHGYCAYEK